MSQSIAFIGVGNMGCPMAENLMKAGKSVKVFDVSKKMLEIAKDKNLETIENLDDLITADVETVITMLPEGKHSKEVYLGENGIINKISKNCLLIDCSTIDIQTSIEIGKKALEKGIKMIDAPVSGGVMGAQKATINIMVGGSKEALDNLSREISCKRFLKLNVSGAFHSPFMDDPSVKFTEYLKQIKFKNPSYPVISNYEPSLCSDSNQLKIRLENQMCNGVRWRETMDLMAKNSDLHFVEIGPSNVLSGLAKRHLKDVKISQVSSSDQISY